MHRRTLSLLATPAVLAAMIVAVPALAGTGSGAAHHSAAHKAGPTAHTAASGHCVTAVVAGHHVRECLLAGPRGPRGFLGPDGPRGIQGKTGKTGATGVTGPAGPQGSAVAYALVGPPGVFVQNTGFTGIHAAAPGVYCLAPSNIIDAASEAPVVSGEAGYSTGGGVPLAVVYAKQPTANCAGNEFEVETYEFEISKHEPVFSAKVAFTIIVP